MGEVPVAPPSSENRRPGVVEAAVNGRRKNGGDDMEYGFILRDERHYAEEWGYASFNQAFAAQIKTYKFWYPSWDPK